MEYLFRIAQLVLTLCCVEDLGHFRFFAITYAFQQVLSHVKFFREQEE